MREININVYCDACVAQGNTVEALEEHKAVAVKVDLGGVKREMDLCNSCAADFVNMSRADTEVKAKPKAKKKGASPWRNGQDYSFVQAEESWQCLYCPASYSTEQGVKQHLSRQHKEFLPA